MSLNIKIPKIGTGSVKMTDPSKVGTQSTAVKTPKAKKMPDGFGKPSLFFKSEDDYAKIKHPSLQKLRDFLHSTKSKNK